MDRTTLFWGLLFHLSIVRPGLGKDISVLAAMEGSVLTASHEEPQKRYIRFGNRLSDFTIRFESIGYLLGSARVFPCPPAYEA